MERRLNRLDVVWSRTGERVVSPEETQLTGRLVFALMYPCSVADADPDDQLRYLHKVIGLSRLPSSAVARSLIAALVQRGVPEAEATAAVRVGGVDAVLRELAELAAGWAARQDAQRQQDAAASEAAYALKKAAGRAAYFRTHPGPAIAISRSERGPSITGEAPIRTK
jgi:hypothetical protein